MQQVRGAPHGMAAGRQDIWQPTPQAVWRLPARHECSSYRHSFPKPATDQQLHSSGNCTKPLVCTPASQSWRLHW